MLFLLGGIFFLPTISQSQILIAVKDAATNQPIEYAQVAALRLNEGGLTDAQGNMQLGNPAPFDSILVSALGYTSEKLYLKTVASSPIVYLKRAPIALSEVAVSAKRQSVKFYTQRIGWVDDRVNTFFNLSRACTSKGTRVVVWIENQTHTAGLVEGVVLKLLARPNAQHPKPTLVRVCALAGSQATGPTQETGTESMIFKVAPGSQTLRLQLAKSQLTLPAQGGFVGVEWVDNPAEALPFCLALTNSDANTNDLSNTWQSYRGKKWTRYGVGYGADGKLRRFRNSNARVDALVAFPKQ
ncbi:hypothetical protein QMK33_15515 [Hymenobacter sp. H14-R3]|nr:hypothetical protein [Hymenobacter sp. H14-R3]